MRVRTSLLTVLISAFALVAPSLFASSQTSGSAADTSWTIMVYMADDYSITLNWQDDINEMEAALQAPGTNIVALVDSYGSGNSQMLKIVNDPNFLNDEIVSTVVDDGGAVISGGEVDMASPSTISSFVQFAAQTYPADRFVLILWGHGASWRGLCPDGTDILTLPELRTGLLEAVTAIGTSLDMVVVDSCAEASVEMLVQLQGIAEVFVGSEKDVPFQGLPYVLVLNDLALSTKQGPARFGSRIVDDYVTWSTTNSDYSVTMGVFNVTRVGHLLEDLSDLSSSGARYDRLFHLTTRDALDSSELYEEIHRVDFADLMSRMSASDLPIEMKYSAVQCLLGTDRVVEYFNKYSNPSATDGILVTNATGLTIYVASTSPVDVAYAALEIAKTPWAEFGSCIRNSTITTANQQGPTVTTRPSALSDPPWPWDTATLSWPESYDSVAAVVFRQRGEGLTYVAQFEKYGTTIEFEIPGELTVAASAEIGDQAVSYAVLNFTCRGRATLIVSLIEQGEPVGNVFDNFTVEITTTDGNALPSGYSPSFGKGAFHCSIDTPMDAQIGEGLDIVIKEAHSGAVVGIATATVEPTTYYVQVQIWNPSQGSGTVLIPALFVALPGILLLAFATLIYRQQRKKP